MATKLNSTCLANAADDEPIFVLRAQDLIAPTIVRQWAAEACLFGVSEEKIKAALRVADDMDKWNHKKLPD